MRKFYTQQQTSEINGFMINLQTFTIVFTLIIALSEVLEERCIQLLDDQRVPHLTVSFVPSGNWVFLAQEKVPIAGLC